MGTQNQTPSVVEFDPKAVSVDELFGSIHPMTREWRDGLFSYIMRNFASSASLEAKWMIMDGDIDPNWIESLNSVMDDSKVLTLRKSGSNP